jgi:two-component system KDP operon response regulator KdpE
VKKLRVLAVDDDERILAFVKRHLESLDYSVLTAHDGFDAVEHLQTYPVDLVVLDVLMPVKDGFETLKELRTFSSVPVIILSAREDDVDKIKGLRLGADDYLPKPFSPDELAARIEAVIRRMAPPEKRRTPEPLHIKDLFIDFNKRIVAVNGQEVYLTRMEWLILSELAHNAGRIMKYEDLLTRIWGPEYRADVQLLRTWISRLRRKIEPETNSAKIIRTMAKTGYIIDPPG